MLRSVLAALLLSVFVPAAMAAPPVAPPPIPQTMTAADDAPSNAFDAAMHQAVGAPAEADLGKQATIRLSGNLFFIPKNPAAKLLATLNMTVPPDFAALLVGDQGVTAPGIVRFVPAGFIDADEALAWSPEDFLASLDDTVERGNSARLKAGLDPLEARRWVVPPRYDPERHQIIWCALILPKDAPPESDGEITVHAISFGRDGYFELSVDSSMEKAADAETMADQFLDGLHFRPGKAYPLDQRGDARNASSLAKAMGIDKLHKAESRVSLWASDELVPVVGSFVAAIGAISLLLYVYRHMRRESRRT